MKKSNFLNNLSWTMIAQIVQVLAQMLIGMFVSRYLGTDNKGSLDYVAAFVSFGTSIVALGVSGVIVNELCDVKNNDGRILGTVMRLQFIVSIITMIAVVGVIAGLTYYKNNDTMIIVLGAIEGASLLFGNFLTLFFWFQAREKMKYVSALQLITQLIVVLYKAVIIICKCSVVYFAFAKLLESIVTAILYYVVFRKYCKEKLAFDKQIGRKIITRSAPFLIADVMILLYQTMDKMMLGSMIDMTSVAYYSAATTIAAMWSVIPTAFLNVIRPKVMSSNTKDRKLYEKRMTETFTGLIYSAIPYSVIITIIGKYVIWLLYGKDFIPGNSALKIVVWYCAFSYIGGGRSIYLICEDKNKYATIFCIWGAIINAVLNWFLIPSYGINGAAFATLLTQIFANVIIPACYKETREYVKYVFKGFIRVDYVINDLKSILKK